MSAGNIAALFVILFVYGWNQYLWPLLVATDPRLDTIVIGIVKMIGVDTCVGMEPRHGHRGAWRCCRPWPWYLLMQRWFVAGPDRRREIDGDPALEDGLRKSFGATHILHGHRPQPWGMARCW